MSSERWQHLEEIFQAALDLAPEKRTPYIAEACAGDEELRRQAEALLAQYTEAGNFLDAPVYERSGVQALAALIDDDPVIGQRIGAYKVVKQIGRGGMGAVYLAERADNAFQKRVAIKLIKRGMDTDFILRRFRHERQILAALDHPFIARLLDGGATTTGQPYFVMEYIEGQPLYRHCDARRLSVRERLRLFCQICEAVEYAHQKQIIHRDLKPSNILVSAAGAPKLFDFGIAKLLNPELASDSNPMTVTAMSMMTVEYASPEQVQGLAVTFLSDVYSLGVLLYELLTGHRPYLFRSRQLHEVARVITEEEPVPPSMASPAVTASVNGGRVRFASSGQVLQIRLEIYSGAGELAFDSGLRPGGVLDWKVADASAALSDGSYLAVVTVRDFHNRLGQKLGVISLQAGQITLGRVGAEGLTAAQAQTLSTRRRSQKIEAAGNNESLTVMREGKERSTVVAAHDGQNGQITSTNGALKLSTGDFFSGSEKEQVRITSEGRVGIGTDNPQATLDVAGTIQARGGIRFEDGTVLTSAGASEEMAQGGTVAAVPVSNTAPANPAGTGTTGNLLKWTNGGAGTAGDSIIKEQNGNIGIGTATPKNKLHVVGSVEIGTTGRGIDPTLSNSGQAANSSQLQFYPASGANVNMVLSIVPRGNGVANNRAQLNLFNTDLTANSTNYEVLGLRARGTDFVLGTGKTGTGILRPLMLGAGILSDTATNRGQLYLATNGNVGVGTITPSQKLEVAGSIKLGGAGSAIHFADGSSLATANGLGGQMTGASILSAINDPATNGTISDNRLSPNLARLNGANAWSGANVFGAGLSANNALITNVGNPVNAGDAVNKAYTDANFVQFVPGTEQLSVGDANGTATMINLRGGSTCCSGPGGHTPAFFKVFQNGSFVATGNLGIGASPMEGKGYRTSWHTYKGAFRSGYADNEWDDANVGFFSWAGGSNSTASGLYALAFGDTNFARSTSSIAFGSGNEVKGAAGFSAGAGNRVCDTYGVALGNIARSGGPYIDGKCDPETFNIRGLAAVAIGYNVTADQDHTMALGKFASNNGFQGTFIWSDGAPQASADTFRNTANNEFAARATGGFRFRTNLGGTTGCNLPAGSGVFNCTSSRSTKENFLLVNGEDVLSRLRVIPVSTWNYIAEGKNVRHMGPMAEDFYQNFRLGTGNTSIGVQDLAGVSLAAIKALDERTTELQQKTEQVEQLRAQVDALRSANAAMEQRLAALEQNGSKNAPAQHKPTGRRR